MTSALWLQIGARVGNATVPQAIVGRVTDVCKKLLLTSRELCRDMRNDAETINALTLDVAQAIKAVLGLVKSSTPAATSTADFVCPICGKGYYSQQDLNTHHGLRHADQPQEKAVDKAAADKAAAAEKAAAERAAATEKAAADEKARRVKEIEEKMRVAREADAKRAADEKAKADAARAEQQAKRAAEEKAKADAAKAEQAKRAAEEIAAKAAADSAAAAAKQRTASAGAAGAKKPAAAPAKVREH